MELLIFATLFFLFLATLLFFILSLDCRVNGDRRISSLGIHRSCMCSIVTDRHCKNAHILKVLSILFVFIVTSCVYCLTGNPEIRSYFFSELMDKDPGILSKSEQLVRLQVLFFRTPNDGKLADALAIEYLERGYFQNAVNTYLDSLRLNGESAPRLVGYGLALVGYEGGIITQEAQNAFQKAADLEPNDFYSRLLLADALHQAGKSEQAAQFLQNFLDTMPKDCAGRLRIEEMIAKLRGSSD
ncbi:tetratricopeptide repeat protein [Bartonella sp. B41]